MIRTKQPEYECGTQLHPLIHAAGFTSVETPASEAHLEHLKQCFDHISSEEKGTTFTV